MKKNNLKIIIFGIIVLLGLAVISLGIYVLFANAGDDKKTNNTDVEVYNDDNDNGVDYANAEIGYSVVISEEYVGKITFESNNNGTNFYYNVTVDDETENILLFFVKDEDAMDDMLDERTADNVEFIGEYSGINYYSATGTGVVVDTVSLQRQIIDSEISAEKKEKLVSKLVEYNNILEITNNKVEILRKFLKTN